MADPKWRDRLAKTVEQNYGRAPYFRVCWPVIAGALDGASDALTDIDFRAFDGILRLLGARDVRVVHVKELGVTSEEPTERLVEACRAVGGKTYISGKGGKNYLRTEAFEKAGIGIAWQQFDPAGVPYPQTGPGFVPGLSVVDCLFNIGPDEAGRLIRGSLGPVTRGVPSPAQRFDLRLGVIGAPSHWIGPDGEPWSYEPYVREMRVWADLFAHVEVCGPAGEGPMQGNQAPYERPNVTWRRVAYAGRPGLSGKVRRLTQLPGMIAAVLGTIRRADVLLLRSPMHFSLVGAACVRLMGRPSVTKWAGLFDAFPGELLTEKTQRWLESRPGRRNVVLVYGPATRAHVVSFLPALMSGDELARGRELAASRVPPPPWRLLSVGRLYWDKGFDLALRGVAELRRLRPDLAFSYTLVGDGPEREALRALVSGLGVEGCVVFAGALPFEQVQPLYAASHVTVMPGVMEGWPKVIAEAWAHGCLPVAASAGLAPWILKEAGAGVLFEPTPEGLASALARVLDGQVAIDPAMRLMERARGLSLEAFRDRLVEVLRDRLGLQLRLGDQTAGRPLRVALVIDTLSRGGAERVLVTLANRLDPRRTEVLVVETRTEGPLRTDLAPHVRHLALGRRSRGDLVALRRLADFLDRERIDIVHTHSHSSAYLMRLVRKLGGQSWRHVVHDHHGPVEGSWVNRTLDRLFLRRIDAYVAVSPRLLAYGRSVIGLPEERCRFLANGIEVAPAEAVHSKEGFTVVQVGRLSPDKDQSTALKVAARLRESVPGLKWLMVGRTGGEARTYAEACRGEATRLGLNGTVTFTGEQADVGPFLRRADMAILTSRAEGLPISLLEAMAASLPVVVTDVGACRGLVEGSGGGIVAAPGDVTALAEAVAALSQDPDRRAELGRRNREFVSRKFGAESMAEQMLSVYEHVRVDVG